MSEDKPHISELTVARELKESLKEGSLVPPTTTPLARLNRKMSGEEEPQYPPFDVEIETGISCALPMCNGCIVAYHTETRSARTGLEPIGPNPFGTPPLRMYSTKYYCNECQVLYNKLPQVSKA